MQASESLLEFPSDFPIKVVGLAADDFDELVVQIVRSHIPNLGREAISRRPSSQGKYLALTITLRVESQSQLDALYIELSGHERILMVL
jgi:uncharacterized protein